MVLEKARRDLPYSGDRAAFALQLPWCNQG